MASLSVTVSRPGKPESGKVVTNRPRPAQEPRASATGRLSPISGPPHRKNHPSAGFRTLLPANANKRSPSTGASSVHPDNQCTLLSTIFVTFTQSQRGCSNVPHHIRRPVSVYGFPHPLQPVKLGACFQDRSITLCDFIRAFAA